MGVNGALDKLGYEIVTMGNWHHSLQKFKSDCTVSLISEPMLMKIMLKDLKQKYEQWKAYKASQEKKEE